MPSPRMMQNTGSNRSRTARPCCVRAGRPDGRKTVWPGVFGPSTPQRCEVRGGFLRVAFLSQLPLRSPTKAPRLSGTQARPVCDPRRAACSYTLWRVINQRDLKPDARPIGCALAAGGPEHDPKGSSSLPVAVIATQEARGPGGALALLAHTSFI
jgi:hypothetical protein